MTVAPILVEAAKLAGSLAAIFGLYWAARQLDLGGEIRIRDAEHARQIARDGEYGFTAVDVALDMAGYSALARDQAGRHVLIWLLGNRFVTRLLPPGVHARLDQRLLTIDPQEPGTVPVTLNLGEAAQHWAAGLRHIRQ